MPVATVDVRAFQGRLTRIYAELEMALKHVDARNLRAWGIESAQSFARALGRRSLNIVRLLGALGRWARDATSEAWIAAQQKRFLDHFGKRGKANLEAANSWVTQAIDTAYRLLRLLATRPRDVAPELLTAVIVSLIVSGGPDGDGGAPDLDLMLGIDAHRSIFSHSIIMGSVIEASFLSFLGLVKIVHDKLPVEHDGWWDDAMEEVNRLSVAAASGASVGMAYHLFVDGLIQPGALKDIPISMPMEMHQAVLVANAAAEALDTTKKGVTQPRT